MALLAGKLYDPGSAVSKACTALLAMTAFDTTNLRLSVTVPASGNVLVRIRGVLHGGTVQVGVLFGVLEGSTVRCRAAPQGMLYTATGVATTLHVLTAEMLCTGLTPGTYNWDAAYGVETVGASMNIKYGGPNNATANDAFGGLTFEVWSVD